MNIVFVKSAEKELLNLDKRLAQRILQKIKLLKDDPYGPDSQKLAGGKGYRVRIGDYRVIYIFSKENQTITIIKVAHRRDVYK